MEKRALILSGGGGRGAFLAGVYKQLLALGWQPQMVCGTSIGGITAAAIGSGMSADRLIALWQTLHRRKVYKIRPLKLFSWLLGRSPSSAIADPSPLRDTLNSLVDMAALRNSPMEIRVPAINAATAELTYFTQKELTVDHLLAAGAIPLVFPQTKIGRGMYWDAGIMANAPLGPALGWGATDVVVVIMSPYGVYPQPPPASPFKCLEATLEQALVGSLQAAAAADFYVTPGQLPPKVTVIAPPRPLGLLSMLNFSSRQAARLIPMGMEAARRAMDRRK